MKDFNLVAYGSDSYKGSHWAFMPENFVTTTAYCEPRVGAKFDNNVFFGLQYQIMRYFAGQVVTRAKIEEAAQEYMDHFGNPDVFNRAGWEHILNEHDGYLPIKIKAIPEGTVVPTGTCLFTIKNLGGKKTKWLTNFVETMIMQVWCPTTVASSSRAIKQIINEHLQRSGTPADLPFKLHDFGFRGVSSLETSQIAGAAHLVNFMGTDTMSAIPLLREYYGVKDMPGFSIPATEHSTMTAEGPTGEANVVRRILKKVPTGLVGIVIDSYDAENFIKEVIGGNEDIKQSIINRDGTVVFRPDSGMPPRS